MIEGLFPVNIYRTQYDNIDGLRNLCQLDLLAGNFSSDRKYQEHLLNEKTSSNIYSWRTNTGAEKIHNTAEFNKIKTFIELHAKIYWDSLGYYSDVNPKIYQSWITHYHHGGVINKHNHGRAQLAGVLYLNASPEHGNIVFENPLELLLRTQPYREEIVYGADFGQELNVNTGDLILFPSYLKHYTLPNSTNEDRIIMSVNLNSDGEYYNPYVEDKK